MNQYQLTNRGKVVLSTLFLFLFIGSYQLLKPMFTTFNVDENNTKTTEIQIQSDVATTLTSGESTPLTTKAVVAESTTQIEEDKTTSERLSETNTQFSDREDEVLNDVSLYNATKTLYYNKHDAYTLSEDNKRALDGFILSALSFKKEKIVIEGYAVNQSSYKHAQSIAFKRAKNASRYLIKEGISQSRIKCLSKVESQHNLTQEQASDMMKLVIYFSDYEPILK